MTISLEEHVARAIAPDGPRYWDNGLSEEYKAQWLACARAAIAAVREYWGEATRAKNARVRESEGAEAAKWIDYAAELEDQRASIRESERAACEAIARDWSSRYRAFAEPMKKPTTRAYFDKAADAAGQVADALAARKGKGEITPSTESHSPAIPQDTGPKRP